MNSSIRRQDETIIVTTSNNISQLEAAQICKRVEIMLSKTNKATLIFAHYGKIALEIKSFTAWETVLACLKREEVKAACFIFEKENAPFRFLAQEYARRAEVPCIQRDRLEQVSA
jgi:hypothetical protein